MATDRNLARNLDDPGYHMLRRAYRREGGVGASSRQRQWQRHDVVRALYTIACGREGVVVDLEDLISALGMPDGQVYNALDHLEQQGAVQTFNGNCVTLLRKGIDAYECTTLRPYRIVGESTALLASGRPGLAATVPGCDLDAAVPASGSDAAAQAPEEV